MGERRVIVNEHGRTIVVAGAAFLAPLIGRAEGAADQAETFANTAVAAAATVLPQAQATVTSNAPGGTIYTLDTGATPFVDGVQYDFLVPATNQGSVSIKVGDNTLVLYDADQALLPAGALVAGSSTRIKLNLPGVRFNLVTVLSPLGTTLDSRTDGTGARGLLESVYGVALALPYRANPNELTVAGPAPANQSIFDVAVTASNTGQTFISKGGVRLRVAQPGTGDDMAAGALVPGTVASLQRSDEGGAVALLVGTRPLVEDAQSGTVGARDEDITIRPWAAVTKTVVIPGSSNASPDYVADGSRPGQMITAALNEAFPGEVNFVADVQAQQGAPWSAMGGQLAASTAFTTGAATWVIPFFWMNDVRTIFYHDYGGVEAQVDAIRSGIDYIRSQGAEPVLVTGFPPDPRASPSAAVKALDPFYFSENPTRGSAYSPAQAAPVDPVAQMRPAATDADFMVARDWTGGGTVRTGYKRLWHFNRGVRLIAAEQNCTVLDLEWSVYRRCIEPIADLSAGLDTFYSASDPLHPLAPLYQQGVLPVITEWARAMASGCSDNRVFRGGA